MSWHEQFGFVVTEQEKFDNEQMKIKKGYAPNLWCITCKGSGFVCMRYGNKVDWNKAVPCPACMKEQYRNYMSNH